MDETLITKETVPVPEPHGLLLTPEAQYYLNEGAGWAKFLGIIGFIGCVFILIMAFAVGTLFSMVAKFSPNPAAFPSGMGTVFGVVYALMALLYFFPSLYIYQFGASAKKGILLQGTTDITAAISKLKSFLKFWGVLMIIGLAFGVLGLIGLFTGLSSLSHMR